MPGSAENNHNAHWNEINRCDVRQLKGTRNVYVYIVWEKLEVTLTELQ